jgi:hypothetical protein
MRRLLVLLLPIVFASCTCGPKRTEGGGVTIEERSDGLLLKGGTLSFFVAGPAAALSIAPWPERPAFLIEASIAGKKHRLIDRSVVMTNGTAAIRHRLEGTDAELLLTIEGSSIMIRATAPRLDPHTKLALHLGTERRHPIVLDRGGPFDDGETINDRSPYVVLGSTVIASRQGLGVRAEQGVSTTAEVEAHASGPVEVSALIATAASTREASLLGARLAHVSPRAAADVILDAATPVRVWLEGKPRVPGPPIVFDPLRDAEKNTPIVDVTAKRTTVQLPEGHWTLRATHGLGYSVVRRDLDVVAGDTLRVKLDVVQETARPEWIGCDFHVHARPSFDATAVSYEERVRSLVAVGVDCAAATEHDHVGDHGPAAAALHLDDRFRALTGVELTTVAPQFGHFNVYPWPASAKVPQVGATTPTALFRAVRSMPGSFIFQVNHPRMRNPEASIGYFDYVALDAHTGMAKGPYSYHRDYDALEIFNGYDLKSLDNVRALATEWLEMLDRGEVHVATGSSDSHGISFPWAGFPRTLVNVGPSWAANGRPIDAIVDALKKGRAYVSSGPLLDLRADDASIGDVVAHPAKLRLRIARTSWLGTPTVQLMLGTTALPLPASTADGTDWVVELDAPVVTSKRPLVAIVENPLIGEAVGLTGFDRALAITNPIWITP